MLLGSPRVTQDLDVCFALDPANLTALGSALTDLDAQLSGVSEPVPFIPDADTLRRVEVLTLETAAGRLDVLARPRGVSAYQSLRNRAERMHLGEFSVRVASLEDLIAMKLAAGRPKDLADVEELEAIRRLRAESRSSRRDPDA